MMVVGRFFIVLALLVSAASPYDITIYQSGRAVVSNVYDSLSAMETNDTDGGWVYRIQGLPDGISSNSVLVDTDIGPVGWHSIYHRPLSKDNILNDYIGRDIRGLLKGRATPSRFKIISYNSDTGDILYSLTKEETDLTHIDRIDTLYPELSDLNRYTDSPILELHAGRARLNTVSLSYIVPGMAWEPEYNLFIEGPTRCSIESGVRFSNDTGTDFPGANITLMHGDIKLPRNEQLPSDKRLATRKAFSVDEGATDDHGTYAISDGFDLLDGRSNRHHNFTLNDIEYSKVYTFAHTTSKRAQTGADETTKASIMYRVPGDALGDRSYPRGLLKVYDVKGSSPTLVGSDSFELIDREAGLEAYTGTTTDVIARFTVIDRKKPGKNIQITLQAEFTNSSESARKIEWTEYVYGLYSFDSKTLNSHLLDANRVRFSLLLEPGKSEMHNVIIEIQEK